MGSVQQYVRIPIAEEILWIKRGPVRDSICSVLLEISVKKGKRMFSSAKGRDDIRAGLF